jgi:tyrosine-protein kinase Etk/Wzc
VETNSSINRYVQNQEPEGLSIKLIKSKILKNWIVFAFLGLAGILIALIYYKIAPPYYKISSTILIKNDGKSSEFNNVFRELSVSKSNPVLQDQVGVLKSYNLNFKTMQYFNWRHSWFKKDWFVEKDLYGNDPFEVVQADDALQTENVRLTVKPISETEYLLDCDEEVTINGSKVEIKFEQKLKFGEAFKNKYFQFTLNKKPQNPVKVDEVYFLIFNNINRLALKYKGKLEVKPVNSSDDSNLILLELVSTNLSRDVDYLNQLGKIYIQFGLDEKNRIANNTIKFIDDQITGVDRSLQVAGDKFTSFRSRNRTVDLGSEASSVVDKLKVIETERANLELKLEYYKNLKFYLENRDQNKDLVAPSLVGVTDDALNSKVLKLNELFTKREVLSYTAQERNPVLIQVTNEIEYTQKTLRENVENLISNTNVELQNLNERQRSVNSQLSRLPKTEQDLIGIKRNFDLNNELYTFLLQRRAEAEISKASNNPDAQILDPTDSQIAVLLGPILFINLFIGLFGGLFIAVVFVVVKELSSELLTDIEDITKRLDVAVVGTISNNKHNTEMPVLVYPRSAITESFRGLRLNLDHFLKSINGKVLAVHSSISGEGKSFVTFNIALIFALGKKKVLLVDGDMRKPRLHTILSQDSEVGLSDFLEGKNTVEEILRPTEIENLWFVASGSAHENSAELLNNGLLKDFIDKAKEQFDYIIFDNSPVGLVYDPVITGMYSDLNLILLRLNYSKGEQIDAINKIGHDGILKRVMVAVNGKKHIKGHGYYTEETKPELIKSGSIELPVNGVDQGENSSLEKIKEGLSVAITGIKQKSEQVQKWIDSLRPH